MVKPKKKRKGDAVQVAYSVMRDVIAIAERPATNKPVKGTSVKKQKPY